MWGIRVAAAAAWLWCVACGWAPGVALAQVCPSGAVQSGRIEAGVRVKLLDVHPTDAYYPMAAPIIGQTGKVDGDLHSNDGCWMGGGFVDDAGTYYYFYKAAFALLAAPSRTCPPGSLTGGVSAGARVKVLDVHPDDAYYPMAAGILGSIGTVREPLMVMDGCWLAGGLDADDGTYYYFYKAAFALLSAPSPSPTATATPKTRSHPKKAHPSGGSSHAATTYAAAGLAVAPGVPRADLGEGKAGGLAIGALARLRAGKGVTATLQVGHESWETDVATSLGQASRDRVEVDVGYAFTLVRKKVSVGIEPWLGVGGGFGKYLTGSAAAPTEQKLSGFGLAYGLGVPLTLGSRPVVELRPGVGKTPYAVGTSDFTSDRTRLSIPALTGLRVEVALAVGFPL